MSIDLGPRHQLFRTSIRKSFLYGVLPFSIVLAAMIATTKGLESDVETLNAFYEAAVSTFVVSGAIILLAIYAYPVVVHDKGIHGYDASMKRKVLWQDMKHAEVVPYLGIPYIRVKSEDGKTLLCIPHNWLADDRGFKSAVIKAAGIGHPLSQFLQDNQVS